MAYKELRALVESHGGFMQHCKRVRGVNGGVWVVSLQGRVGVFSRREGDFYYPELEDLYSGNHLHPDAKERLYERLE